MPCQRSDEIPTTFFHVRLARIEHVPNKDKNSVLLDFQFLENIDFEWSANLHLKILAFVRELKAFRDALEVVKGVDPEQEEQKITKKKTAIDWRVAFKGETNLGLILSKENNMLFATGEHLICAIISYINISNTISQFNF